MCIRDRRQTVLGGYCFGLSGTFTSFIILGNYSLGLQMHGKLDLMAFYEQTGDLYQTIIAVFETMPLAKAGLVLLAITMIAFYATSFDALTMVASSYSCLLYTSRINRYFQGVVFPPAALLPNPPRNPSGSVTSLDKNRCV